MKCHLSILTVAALAATIAFGGASPEGPSTTGKRHRTVRNGSRVKTPTKASVAKRQGRGAATRGSSVGPKAGTPKVKAGVGSGGLMGLASCAKQELNDVPEPCPCGSSCACAPGCWCHGSHAPSTTGSTSGSTASTDGSTSGATAGTTSSAGGTGTTSTASTTGSTSSTAGSNTGSTSGSTDGTTTGTTSTTGSTATSGANGSTDGSSTGGTTGGTNGGAAAGWDTSGSETTVAGAAENGYVSGTNVNVTFTLRLKRPAGSRYVSAVVSSADLKIGGETDSAWNQSFAPGHVLPPDANGECTLAIPVRFASTRFLDDRPVNLNATFHYQLQDAQGIHTGTLDAVLPTFHAITYNKGLTLDSQLYVNCLSGVYVWQDPEFADNYDMVSQRASPLAISGLSAMRHTTPTNSALSRLDALKGLNRMTAFFAFTHGEPDGILPTFGAATDKHAESSDKMKFSTGASSDIGKAVRGDPADLTNFLYRSTLPPIPLPNMVVLHACSGLGSGSEPILKAFGLLGPNESAVAPPATPAPGGVGRAIAAFPYVVHMRLLRRQYPDEDVYLSDHARRVYASLAKGLTLKQAVDAANEACTPARTNCDGLFTEMLMQVKGDNNARLVGVYTGDASDPTNPLLAQHSDYYPYRWYLVNP